MTPEQRRLFGLDRLLIIDLECTCFRQDVGTSTTVREGEIIEVGYADFDLVRGQVLDSGSVFVRPMRTQVTEFCTQLTGIRPEDVARAPEFSAVCAVLRSRFRKHLLWGSWGSFDKRMLNRQCEVDRVESLAPAHHVNINSVLAPLLGDKPGKEFGLMKASAALGLAFEGRLHRGVDDALVAGKILVECRRRFVPTEMPTSAVAPRARATRP